MGGVCVGVAALGVGEVSFAADDGPVALGGLPRRQEARPRSSMHRLPACIQENGPLEHSPSALTPIAWRTGSASAERGRKDGLRGGAVGDELACAAHAAASEERERMPEDGQDGATTGAGGAWRIGRGPGQGRGCGRKAERLMRRFVGSRQGCVYDGSWSGVVRVCRGAWGLESAGA